MVKIGEPFSPHPDLKKLYRTYLLLVMVIGLLSWMIPSAVASYLLLDSLHASILTLSLFLPLILGGGFVLWWIGRYYDSISFLLGEEELVVERGVWWRKKSYVPYNRVTNVEVIQGPIARHYGLGTVSIQTAGFSSTKMTRAEAEVFGVKIFEEVREILSSLVTKRRPVAVEAEREAPGELDREILEELRSIRRILESRGL